ncbi:MAG TPA: three-Cys-motif partner protein TcmP [Bacteroidota bacterium]
MTSAYPCPCGIEPDEGICHVPSEEDGLPVRCVGGWSCNKHFYIERYIGIFHTGMSRKWPDINYIDLFAGPGKCRIRKTREITDGSPMIASQFGFTGYHLVDMNPDAVEALQKRFPHGGRAKFYPVDCNACADEIGSRLSASALSLLVADQTAVQLKFETLRLLTEGKRVDMIIYLPTGVYFNRAIPTVKDEEKIKSINDFFGDRGEGMEIWRTSPPTTRNNALVAYYKDRLKTIGYQFDAKVDRDIVIANEENNVELYRLILASKHVLGSQFWRKIQQVDPKGQRELPFS